MAKPYCTQDEIEKAIIIDSTMFPASPTYVARVTQAIAVADIKIDLFLSKYGLTVPDTTPDAIKYASTYKAASLLYGQIKNSPGESAMERLGGAQWQDTVEIISAGIAYFEKFCFQCLEGWLVTQAPDMSPTASISNWETDDLGGEENTSLAIKAEDL